MRLNAQYATMVRTSLSVLGRLMRVQAVRQKRASIESAANDDAWALHIAERCMLRVLDPKAGPPAAAPPEAPPKMVPEPTHPTSPEAAPPPDMNRQIDQPFSE